MLQRTTRSAELSAVLASFVLAMLCGCASEGPLRPPSLKLPAAVTHLTADRTGNAADLHWSTPSKTTDGVSLTGKHGAGALVAEICRDEAAAAAACAAPERVPVTAGEAASFHDVLPPPLLGGPLRPLHYRVRVVNGLGRGAKYSEVETLAGVAPAPVRGLEASRTSEGAMLRWQAETPHDELRTYLRVERGPVGPPQTTQKGLPGELLALDSSTRDPGGAVDPGAKPGIEQRYTVYRTRTVHAGGRELTAGSIAAAVTLSAAAKAPPPPPPSGIEALVNTLAAPEIDLVWQPVEGASGYLVFRAAAGGAPVRLTAQPVPGLSYNDAAVRPGVRYRYSIVSVDASGASGPPSPGLVESVPQP